MAFFVVIDINLLILLSPIPDNYKCLSIPINYLSNSSIPSNPTLAKECHEQCKQLIHYIVALHTKGLSGLNCVGEVMCECNFKQAVCIEEGISVWWAGRVYRRQKAGERQVTNGKHRLCVIEGTVGVRGARSFTWQVRNKPTEWGNRRSRIRRWNRVLVSRT